MNQREDNINRCKVLESFFRVFLCVSFPVKVSQFTIFFLACKKVDYERKCFSSTPDITSTRTKKQFAPLINDR